MKLTDFALLFVAVFLPVVIIVYVNTSFVIKSEKQEMYYKNLMNSAVKDAVSAMKQIENEDESIDYGYSGERDNKVSINSSIAISTFYSSLENNFNIKNNEISKEKLKLFIPVIAILDYDGIYIHSAESNDDKETIFVTKPKVQYTYYYVIKKDNNANGSKYKMVELEDVSDIKNQMSLFFSDYIYEVNFTMDDYIYLNIYKIDDGRIGNIEVSKSFYLKDSINNYNLVYGSQDGIILLDDRKKLVENVAVQLNEIRKKVIAETSMKEIAFAINKHNIYAKNAGITYNFTFSVESDTQWYETIDGIGIIAIIQGISLGNRYLNYKAYSASDLVMTKRYYVSDEIKTDNSGYFSRKLYHESNQCIVYQKYLENTDKELIPGFYASRADAATQGFYPCPVCHP